MSRHVLISNFCLIASMAIAFFVVLVSNNSLTHLIALVSFTAIALLLSKFDISKPMFLFSFFFFLYSGAYLVFVNFYPTDSFVKGYDKLYTIMNLIMYFIVLLISTAPKDSERSLSRLGFKCDSLDAYVFKTLLLAFDLLLIVCCFILLARGYTHKSQLWASHDLFWSAGAYLTRFIAFSVAFIIVSRSRLNFKKTILAVSFLSVLLFSLTTGERDAIFRFILIVGLSLFVTGRIKKWWIIAGIPAGILVMILSTFVKYWVSAGTLDFNYLARGDWLYLFLYSDFLVCGANIQVLLNNPITKGALGFKTLFFDLIAAFLPASVMNDLFGADGSWNSSTWFNNTFYEGSTFSRDFSVVGEGYVIGGLLGVVVVSILMGLIIRFLFKKAFRNAYWASIYVYGMVAIISSFRDTFSTIVSSMVRVPVLLLLIVWVMKSVLGKRTTTNEMKRFNAG